MKRFFAALIPKSNGFIPHAENWDEKDGKNSGWRTDQIGSTYTWHHNNLNRSQNGTDLSHDLVNDQFPSRFEVKTDRQLAIQGIRKYLTYLTQWTKGDPASEPEMTEVGCIVLDTDGKVIWDNRWMRFEHKCWLAFGLAVLVGLLTRPALRR